MLPDTVAALAGKDRVSVAHLFEFEFLSQTVRFWDGIGYLNAGGKRWQGSGKLISATGLEQSQNLSAPQATFTLSRATSDLVAFAADSEEEVTGRPVRVFLQFLSRPYVTLDEPVALWAGKMDVPSFSIGLRNFSISITAESLFVERVRAQHGYMTDTDQQTRWPGDKGMEFMALLLNKTTKWLRG